MIKGAYYFPFYYQRIITSTTGWSDAEFGCYVRLLTYQFDKGSIPSDAKERERISPGVKKHWGLLSKKFIPDGNGGLINEVMQSIREGMINKKNTNSKNGKMGGRPKKTDRFFLGYESENRTKTETKGIPITNNQKPKERENTDHSHELFSIDDCLAIAKMHPRWMTDSGATEQELWEFNKVLRAQGVERKNPADYKKHFYHWKKKGGLSEQAGCNQQVIDRSKAFI